MKLFTIVGLLLSFVGHSIEQCKIVQCTVTEGDGLTTELIDPFLCTHVTYQNLDVTEKFVYMRSETVKHKMQTSSRLNALKERNPELKTWFLLHNDRKDEFFFDMYKNSTSRKQFIQETIKFLRQHNFDGLELSIFYYGSKSDPEFSNFVLLLQEMSSAFKTEKLPPGKSTLTVTVQLMADKRYIDTDYDIPGISKYADYMLLDTAFINDFQAILSYVHMTPLYGRNSSDTQSLDFYARYVVSKGADKKKLVLSLPTFGIYYINVRYFSTYYESGYVYHSKLHYIDVCAKVIAYKMVVRYDDVAKAPYAESKVDAIRYEDVNSIKLKVDYIKKNGFAGVGIYTLGYDDYVGLCHRKLLPLSAAIKQECSKK